MTCDICGEEGARVRHVTRSYGQGKDLLVIENIPAATSTPRLAVRRNRHRRGGGIEE